jgi:hypothetical protein
LNFEELDLTDSEICSICCFAFVSTLFFEFFILLNSLIISEIWVLNLFSKFAISVFKFAIFLFKLSPRLEPLNFGRLMAFNGFVFSTILDSLFDTCFASY